MGETLNTVEELVAQGGEALDVTWIYEQWRDRLAGLMTRVQDKFELELDPSTKGLEVAGELGSGIHGQVQCFAGPEIDWMVYSWMADPKNGFANLHLTISPGGQTDMPLFGMAFACFGPRPWGFIDFAPRKDMAVDREYYMKYYEPMNQHWLDVRRDNPNMDWFTSPTAFIRQVTSPVAFCYSGQMEQPTIDLIQSEADFYLDTWLSMWDTANEIPVDERQGMVDYTENWRRTVSELDPANSIARRLFGEETEDLLVSTLWGRDRVLPHALGKK